MIELVNEHGTLNWNIIASLMENRNPRQCKERWKHYLSVRETRENPFSPEEDRIIFVKFSELGPKWTKISSFLPGRSDTDIKYRVINFIRYQYNITGLRYAPTRKRGILPEQNPVQIHVSVPVQLELNQEDVAPEPLEFNQESDPNGFEIPQFFEGDYESQFNFDDDGWPHY